MTHELVDFIQEWREVPDVITAAITGLSGQDLDLRAGGEGWTIRETVHHLVEANLVASTMVIAALGKSGCAYDWSWLIPDREWMARLHYDKAPVGPALHVLRALTEHLSAVLIAASPDVQREVKLVDAPGAQPRSTTIRGIIQQQTGHVRDHIGDIRQALEHYRNQVSIGSAA